MCPPANTTMKISPFFRTVIAIVCATATLTACDVESFDDAVDRLGTNPPPAPPPPPPPPPPPVAFGPNFSEIQTNVFTPNCATSGCHAGAVPSAGLNLSDANSFAELVGIASSQDGNFDRVVPTEPDNSYLIHKLEDTATVGGVMPPGGALPQSSIDTVRQWISDGAIDDRVVVLNPIQVSSLAPMPNDVLDAQPTQIVAGFTRDLDVATVNALTFVLESSGGDGTFLDGNEVQIISPLISVPGGNPQTAVFDLTGVVLADDSYRIRLLGMGGSFIMDLDANALDGEFAAVFPSGNGIAGGDFQALFSIATPVAIGPTLAQIQAVVFTPTCATSLCHAGGGPVLPGVMDLSSEAASRANLVNIDSIQDNTVFRVNPDNPDMSYLITKLESAGVTGAQMPLNQAALSPAVIAEIRQWITDGVP